MALRVAIRKQYMFLCFYGNFRRMRIYSEDVFLVFLSRIVKEAECVATLSVGYFSCIISGKAQLNQKSNGVVIIDSVQGFLIISVWISGATGVESGIATRAYLSPTRVVLSILSGHHLRVKMGCAPLDRAHKGSIWMALVSCRGANAI
eukprot:1080418-Pelagomonas_calceolata.AAC.1